MLSQREAASKWLMSRATIQRAIKDGKLSLTPDKRIDPAEMLRVFGEPSRPESHQTRPDNSTYEPPLRERELEAKVEHLTALLAAKDENLADLRAQVLRLSHDIPEPFPSRRQWWPFRKA